MDTKKLCLQLLAAECESEVQKIIERIPEMSKAKNWKPLDGRETNFNVTSNQASDGGKALTELMTNMVDAVLMKHAHQKGINPKGKEAPKTMYEAVDKLIKNLRGGKLVNLDPKDPWLREFAQKNLVIGITGAKTKKEGLPCYTFADNGEGQRPQDFPETFLSLSKGNKKDIRFVQGKYNMGGSGVLGYCGLLWYKLVISRRYDAKSPWGWTLLRRRPGVGMPVAEYLTLPDGAIPSFDSDMLYPFQTGNGKKYSGISFTTGTIVKLYDYQVGSRFMSFRGSREALNENLVETILPFRLLDFRQKPDPKRSGERAEGIDPRPFYGMEFLLLRSHKENETDDDEDEAVGTEAVTVASIEDPDLGEINIKAIPLKRNLPGWLQPTNTNNRVFHAVNGQVQFKQTRGYLSQTCGLPALKDRVIVIVDASRLLESANNFIWKGDREHINNTIYGERYKEMITVAIKESEALKQIQQRIAREELDRAAQSERNDLFQKLVDSDRTLAGLLTNRDPQIRLPASGGINGRDKGSGIFEGKYSPTFLRFEGKVRETGLNVPINRSRPVSARTDAENGYLLRTDNPGRVVFEDEARRRFTIRSQLHNGRLTLFLAPIEGKSKIGDTFILRVGLADDAITQKVSDEVTVRIVEPEEVIREPKEKRESKQDKPDSGAGSDKKGDESSSKTHGLPRHVLLTQDGRMIGGKETQPWPSDFTPEDGGLIEELGDGEFIYKINYDNVYHLKYRQEQRGDVARDVVTEKYVLGMLILMLGFEHAFRMTQQNKKPQSDGSNISEYSDEIRRMAARGSAATVLALAENLPKIVNTAEISNMDVE